jgi:seryl-tRNA synthetase
MFAWTSNYGEASTAVFDEIVSIQIEILQSLGLHCRILEMPSEDLGASATRKRDIEAFFPSRRLKDDGWGEVTSVSTCSDYQTRRLATKVDLRTLGGKLAFPYTVNGTALAVPRVLAAILENGWDEKKMEVRIPEVLWPWMDGLEVIKNKERQR